MRVTTFPANKEIVETMKKLSFASSMRNSAKCTATASYAYLND